MKFTSTLASTLLLIAPLASALPTTTPQITMRITNDLNGASAVVTVPAGGAPREMRDLLCGTALDDLVGTSVQLTAFTDGTKCELASPTWVFELDGRAKNFVDLDDGRTQIIPVWLGGFTFACKQA